MKNILSFLGIIFAFTSLFLFSGGCGSNNLTSVLTADYFPINVGDIRNMRRTITGGAIGDFTQTVEAQTTLNENQVFPFTTRDTLGNVIRIDYYEAPTSEKFSVCGFDDFENNFSSRYNPCITFNLASAGQVQNGTVQVSGGGGLANAVSADFSFTPVSFETITVPAGTFESCAASAIRVISKNAEGSVIEDGTFSFALCPDIGNVRIAHDGLSISAASSVLTSAVIGGRAIP